ncbi:MAG: molybdopterin molybdotransferase MoeA [SAR202 cluster bacterium]|nr:molybdopterin molybdotransferase MoeA [SAR202 cluster bacterium]
MPEFFNVVSPTDAVATLNDRLERTLPSETIRTTDSLHRVTASTVVSGEILPAFARSSMDGYSVRAQDTYGASESLPALLNVIGDVVTGQQAVVSLGVGDAAVAYTGGMLANGADAVVIVERTLVVDENTIEVTSPVAPGENVVQIAEDVETGDVVLPQAHLIRAQDIGAMLALGITEVEVIRKPKVAIVSTGDELVPPEETPRPGQIRDINTYTIAARVLECGAVPITFDLAPDDFEVQLALAQTAFGSSDVLIFSAGSSLSSRDMTVEVLNRLGEPGVLVHGISIKPGKPTIVGFAEGKPLFGLPGNPVSAVVVFDLVVRPIIHRLSGLNETPMWPSVTATLTKDAPSVAGREDHIPVRLRRENGVLCAEPVFGKSNLIFTLVKSDGMIVIPMDGGGRYAGEQVEVRLHGNR